MFLKRITLTNFKCLSNIDLSFENEKRNTRKWTLILGKNGTGKSNILKAIALVTAGSNALGELLRNTDSWIKYGQNSCSIIARLETKKGEERTISITINRGDNLAKIISSNQEALQLIDSAIEKAGRNYFVVGYGASRRLSSEKSSNFDQNRDGRSINVRNLFDSSTVLNPLASWIVDLDYRSGEAGLEIVKTALQDFLPGIAFHSIDKENRQILFQTLDGLIPLDQLSDGYQNMAAWIGDLLYRITETFKDYKNPLEARGLLLIDEIDLHLHPTWQRMLNDFIGNKLPNFQIIASTHSPLTAQQSAEGELYGLNRNLHNEIELVPFIGSPKSLLINQLLMTPIFGLDSDESYEIQQTKREYEILKAENTRTAVKGTSKIEVMKNVLKENLPQRNSVIPTLNEIALLEKIEEKLNATK